MLNLPRPKFLSFLLLEVVFSQLIGRYSHFAMVWKKIQNCHSQLRENCCRIIRNNWKTTKAHVCHELEAVSLSTIKQVLQHYELRGCCKKRRKTLHQNWHLQAQLKYAANHINTEKVSGGKVSCSFNKAWVVWPQRYVWGVKVRHSTSRTLH